MTIVSHIMNIDNTIHIVFFTVQVVNRCASVINLTNISFVSLLLAYVKEIVNIINIATNIYSIYIAIII